MLSASMIFSYSGIITYAEGVKDKKQEYYQEYKRIIREANEKIGSKDFDLLPIDEINEDDMLTPKEFQKAVNAAIQLDTQKPVIDDNGGEYSNESTKRGGMSVLSALRRAPLIRSHSQHEQATTPSEEEEALSYAPSLAADQQRSLALLW